MSTGSTAQGALAVIGGSGLYCLGLGEVTHQHQVHTPFAHEPVLVSEELTAAGTVRFLPRHGSNHTLAPHQINYRANLWALHALGVKAIVAVNATGGISPGMTPGTLVFPDQLIDYSWGREHTFFHSGHALDNHVDFTIPYDPHMAMLLANSAKVLRVPYHRGGVYGCTQGPRLETAAEIRRMQRDGCDIVGMTGMPEVGLARELGLRYASMALVVNRAAGMGVGNIAVEQIKQVLANGVQSVRSVLSHALPALMSLET